nr:hypothetical protein [Actinoplanes sp. DH11]
MGLFLIVLMCVATVLLIRNMNKRIRRLPDSFTGSAKREGVAEIAHRGADAQQPAAGAAADVEADRSAAPVTKAEPEVTAVADDELPSAKDGGAARA